MIRVLVTTPLGRGGNGGIDRLMDLLRDEITCCPPAEMEVRFAETRGAGSILLAPLVLVRFLACMALWRPHIVHVNLASRGSTYRKLRIAALARVLHIGTVIHLHGAQYREFWDKAPAGLSQAIARMFTNARRVVVLGEVWRDYVIHKAPGAKVVVLPNATSRPTLPPVPSDGSTRLLFLGKLGARKGSRDLVAALASLANVPGWHATLAGDGEVDDTRAMVKAAGLDMRVSVPGWANPQEVAAMIAAADVLILPSYDENLPMSVIEGMAAGLAVVATPVGAVEDIVIHGETGLLISPGDILALAEALRRLVDDPALRVRLGVAAQAVHRQRLDIKPYVTKLVELWREAAMEGGANRR